MLLKLKHEDKLALIMRQKDARLTDRSLYGSMSISDGEKDSGLEDITEDDLSYDS